MHPATREINKANKISIPYMPEQKQESFIKILGFLAMFKIHIPI